MPLILPPGPSRAFVLPFSRTKGVDVFKSIINHIKINSNLYQSLTGSFLELSEGKTAMRSSRVQPGASWLSFSGLFFEYLINRASRLSRSAVFTSCGGHASKILFASWNWWTFTLSTLFKSRSISRCVARDEVFLLLCN